MLLDTSGLLCLVNPHEPHHKSAREVVASNRRGLIHTFILAEFIASTTRARIPRSDVFGFIDDLAADQSVDVVYVDEALYRRAMDLLRNRLDKTWSLCDAISFILMSDRGLREALTTDHHFEQAGFVRLLA